MKYLVLFVIFSFSILSFASAYADDEAKSVKHTPYKNMCAPGFVPLDDICVLNDRCGPGVYPGKVCVLDGKPQPYLRPTQQGNAGIAASDVICAEGLNLIFKTSDSSPACVKDSSIDKLSKRGWQTHVPIFACTLEYAPVCGVDGITYGNMCMLESRNIAMDHSGECAIKKLTEFELDEKFRATQDKITQVSHDIYNGKYNGEMPLNDALSILLDGKTTLTGLNDQYKALDKEMKSDMQIAMRFSTYGRMGYASLDSQINMVKNQITSSHTSP